MQSTARTGDRVLRYSSWDGVFVVLALMHGILLVAVPHLLVITLKYMDEAEADVERFWHALLRRGAANLQVAFDHVLRIVTRDRSPEVMDVFQNGCVFLAKLVNLQKRLESDGGQTQSIIRALLAEGASIAYRVAHHVHAAPHHR